MQTTTLIESRTNLFGIEVRHERTPRGERLAALRNGTPAAHVPVERGEGELPIVFDADHEPELERALQAALVEARRVLRDGRGLE